MNITAIQLFNRVNDAYVKFLAKWLKEKPVRYYGSGKKDITVPLLTVLFCYFF